MIYPAVSRRAAGSRGHTIRSPGILPYLPDHERVRREDQIETTGAVAVVPEW